MPELRRPDATVHYLAQGEGPPVTLLHGFTQRATTWDGLVARLPYGFRYIRLDLRGHGRTQADPDAEHSLEATARDVEAIWDHLGIDSSHLLGYSMGGRLALWMAATRPRSIRSLVAISAHAGFEGERRETRVRADQQLAARIEREGAEWFAAYWSALPMFSRLGPELQRGRLDNRPEGLAASLRGMGAAATPPFWDRLKALRMPALFIAGADDPPYPAHAERLGMMVNESRVAVVTGAGHSVHLEQPETVAALIAEHLSRL